MDGWEIAALAFTAVALVGSGLKGKWGLMVLSVFVPFFVLVAFAGALRVAKPTSVWARRLYDDEEMLRSIERYSTPEEFEKFEAARHEKDQGRTGFGSSPDPKMAEYGKIGASKDEIGEIAPPIN
jgi:hypothetical protein